MAQQYQYQPITGPVWTEPVAAKLAWLPSDRYAGRALARAALRDWSIYPLQPPVASYDPNALDWLSRVPYVGRALPRGRLDWGESSQPSFVYDLVDWLPQGQQQPARVLARVPPRDWSVYPFQVQAAAYDPRELGWLPRGIAPQVPLERRRLGDFAQPSFSSLYRPEGLQWLASDRYAGRALQRALLDWTVELQLVSAPVYEPSTLEWIPQGRAPRVAIERRIRGDFQQPPFVALYRPERLEWQPRDRYYGRPLPYSEQGWTWAFSIPIEDIPPSIVMPPSRGARFTPRPRQSEADARLGNIEVAPRRGPKEFKA